MADRVVVTGGAGFIGSHVADVLLARGCDVHVIDDLSKGQVEHVPEHASFHMADIAEPRVERLVAEIHPDAIVHCAAQTNVMRSLADPELDRRINIDGLQRVIAGASRAGVSRFVFISSGGAAYGETDGPADEDTPPRPGNPYGQHKIEGEAVVAAIGGSISLRLANVYGTRQRSDAEGGVISIFADRLLAKEPLRIYGNGEQERDFVHVSDVVAAILLALEDTPMAGVWNVATGVPTRINDLALAMIRAFGGGGSVEYLAERHEIQRSCLSIDKLLATGKWLPRCDLVTGLDQLARAAHRASKR